MATAMVFKGRGFEASEIELIENVVESYPKLSRQELANTVCELLEWRRPGGGLKTWEAKDLLISLEEAGRFRLPALRSGRPRGSHTSVPCTVRGDPGELRLTKAIRRAVRARRRLYAALRTEADWASPHCPRKHSRSLCRPAIVEVE